MARVLVSAPRRIKDSHLTWVPHPPPPPPPSAFKVLILPTVEPQPWQHPQAGFLAPLAVRIVLRITSLLTGKDTTPPALQGTRVLAPRQLLGQQCPTPRSCSGLVLTTSCCRTTILRRLLQAEAESDTITLVLVQSPFCRRQWQLGE